MKVEYFDSLTKRDFQNGAILDSIRSALRERDRLQERLNAATELLQDVPEDITRFGDRWLRQRDAFLQSKDEK